MRRRPTTLLLWGAVFYLEYVGTHFMFDLVRTLAFSGPHVPIKENIRFVLALRSSLGVLYSLMAVAAGAFFINRLGLMEQLKILLTGGILTGITLAVFGLTFEPRAWGGHPVWALFLWLVLPSLVIGGYLRLLPRVFGYAPPEA